MTLRLEDASGAFAGVAAGSIDPQYLSEEFARAGLGGSGYVRLVRGDQVLLSQHPYSAEELGRIVPSAAGEAGRSRFQFEPISEDGQIVVVAAVSNSDMFVVAAQSQDAALAHHWAAFWQEFAIVAGLIVALAVGAVFLVFEMRRREKAEVAVRLQEERSRAYAQASNDWFWETDSGLRFVWVSRSVEISLGLRSSWFIGKQFEDVIQAGKSAEFEAQWRSLGARQSFHDLECDVAGKHGRRTILVSGIPYFDDAGAFKGYRGSTKDVTALRLTEQNLRDAIRSFPGRVMIFDRNERLTLFNNGSNAPLDSVASQLRKGDSFERILHKLVDAGIIEDANDDPAAWIAERLRRFRRRECGVILRMGGKVVEATDAPMADGGTISLRFDVTERELARERAEAARRDAERANQAKSEFLASMSHEFRTPLNAIIGFSQLLLMDKASSMSSDEKEYVTIVESSGRHLLNLVSEILGTICLTYHAPVPISLSARESVTWPKSISPSRYSTMTTPRARTLKTSCGPMARSVRAAA